MGTGRAGELGEECSIDGGARPCRYWNYPETTIGEIPDLEIRMYEHHWAPGPDGREEGWLTVNDPLPGSATA